jgi:hypothetical protein
LVKAEKRFTAQELRWTKRCACASAKGGYAHVRNSEGDRTNAQQRFSAHSPKKNLDIRYLDIRRKTKHLELNKP